MYAGSKKLALAPTFSTRRVNSTWQPTVHDTLPKTTSPKRHFAETTQCRKFFSGATLRRKFQMINNESCLRETNVIRRALIALMGT